MKLRVDDLLVSYRVYTAIDVNDVVVLKASHNMCNRVHLADVGEELIPEALSLGCTFDQAGNVNKLKRRWDYFGWVNE